MRIQKKRQETIETKRLLDLEKLTPEARKRVDRVLNPRDYTLSIRFPTPTVEVWKATARAAGKSMTEWVWDTLDAASTVR